jgi:hypothetical protein
MIENSLLIGLISLLGALALIVASKLITTQDPVVRIPVRMDDDYQVQKIAIRRK